MNYYKQSVLLTVLVVLVVYLVASLIALGAALGISINAKNLAYDFKDQLDNSRTDEAMETLFSLENRLDAINFLSSFSFWIKAVPVIRHDYNFYSDLVSAGGVFLSAATDGIKELSRENVSLNLSPDTLDFKNALTVYLSHHDDILKAIDKLKKVEVALSEIHLGVLPSSLTPQVTQLFELLEKLSDKIELLEPFLDHVPYLLGQDVPQDILVLLQNPDELRPTGGFIGTIGRIRLNNGVLEQLQTDDVYSVDGRVLGREQFEAPEPIQRYMEVKNWYLRDANWSPDFETAAKDVKSLYEYESGEEGIDTIIATTPFIIEQLLNITGPIIVDGIEFNAANLVDALQYRVEQEFWQIGLTQDERKGIINDLAQALQQELFHLTPAQIIKFFSLVRVALDQREILVYTTSSALQEVIVEQGYDGQIFDIGADYLYIVDANLGALKTDRVIVRERNYELQQLPDGKWMAKLRLDYTNNGTFDYRTTRYRTYTRVYVPIGSYLISAQGLMLTDRTSIPGKVEVYEEFNKTVFAGFVSIEPGQTRSVTYTYQLPNWLSTQFEQRGVYELYFQKQPGVENQTLNANLDLLQPINGFSPTTTNYQTIDQTQIEFSESIFGDNLFQIQFEPSS